MTPISDQKLAEIEAGLEGVTPGPYHPCVHLRSKEGDENCSCGYRGGVWSTTTDEILFEMGGTAEQDGTKMVPEPDRDTRRLNAQHLARFDPATIRSLIARVRAAEDARDAWKEEVAREGNRIRVERDDIEAEIAELLERPDGVFVPYDGWQDISTAPDLERVFVAGWQKPRGTVAAYWWLHEDHTDERGVPTEHPDALKWCPLPPPPPGSGECRTSRAARVDWPPPPGSGEWFEVAPRMEETSQGPVIIRNRIREVRKSKGIKQNELAEKMNCHWITVSKLERGLIKLNTDWMAKLSEALGVPFQDLLADADKKKDSP